MLSEKEPQKRRKTSNEENVSENVSSETETRESDYFDWDTEVKKLQQTQTVTASSVKNSEVSVFQEQLAKLEQEYEREEDVGTDVGEQLARLVNRMAKGMPEEVMKQKSELYKRPSNCSEVIVPKVNVELWSELGHETKTLDVKMQSHQRTLCKVACALIQAVDENLKESDAGKSKTLFATLTDALGLTLKSLRDISLDRRNRIVRSPSINAKYRRLGSTEVPITRYLFGDDISGAVRAIESSSKLGRHFARSSRGRKFFPHSSSSKNWDHKNKWDDKNKWDNKNKYNQSKKPYGRGRGRGGSSYSQKPQQPKSSA